MEPKLFVATKAFIVHDGKVLILRESSKYDEGAHAAEYDVVGGRVKPGQRFDDSLRREITEETGLEVELGRPFHTDEWRPVVKGEGWQIIGTYFLCEAKTTEVQLSQDHDDFQWIDPATYEQYPLIDNLKRAFVSYLALK
jgi:8-oxo-dGTP diphosphatase